MKRCREPNSIPVNTTSGMTLIEVVLILVVIGILAATVAVRMSSGTVDLTVAKDAISSHLRLVQTLAMNNSQGLWGIQFDSDNQKYRVFQCENESSCDANADKNAVSVPGMDTDTNGWITLSGDIKLKSKNKNKDNVAFDAYGKPYEVKNGASPLQNQPFTLTLEDGAGNSREIQVTPKTGFIP